MEVNKLDHGSAALKKCENGNLQAALVDAGRLIEEARAAVRGPELTRKHACALMFISEPQYSRWISGASNDTPSFARLLLLPPTFWFQMNKLLNQRYGLRKLAVAELLGCAADVALAVQE